MDLPSGTVTFLFTDVEGSTRLLQSLGDDYVHRLGEHALIIETAIRANNGIVVNTEGDAYFCVFDEAPDAAAAAVEILRDLAEHDWPNDGEFKVRVGFHTGEGVHGAADYVGMDVHRAARISAAGHGGQALLSADSHELVARHLPEGVTTSDLGEHNLKDLPEAEHLYQLVVPGLESAFPPLRVSADPPLPLPPLVAPAPTARAQPATATSGGFLSSFTRAQLAALTLVAGLAVGTGAGAALFGGDQACEVCAEPNGQAGVASPTTADSSPTSDPQVTTTPTPRSTSSTGQAESIFSGTWLFTVRVTAVTGSVCQGEIGDVYDREVTISGPDDALTIVGFDNLEDPDDPAWAGSFANETLTFGGTRAEDDGLTTATFEMEASSADELHGFEAWTWDWTSQGETGTCVDGQSTVTASRTH